MNSNISNINLSQLKKLEVQYLATSVIRIVEKHNPESLKIKEIFDELVEQKPQIKLLKVQYGPHPITPKINKLRKRRNAFCQGMMDQMKAIENGQKNGTEEALIIAKPIVLHYLQGLSKNNEKILKQILVQFFDVIADDEEFETALSTLDLMSHANNLRLVMNEIDEQYNLRLEKISARPKMNTRGIVAKLKIDIQDMFKQIEVAQIKHKDINYNLLIDELNKEILLAKAEIKTRASNNKKKAEGEIDNNEIVVEDVSRKTHESTETTQGVNPLSVEVGNENPGLIDIEKTAAMPGKQTRLPIVSTEG